MKFCLRTCKYPKNNIVESCNAVFIVFCRCLDSDSSYTAFVHVLIRVHQMKDRFTHTKLQQKFAGSRGREAEMEMFDFSDPSPRAHGHGYSAAVLFR
jgi:hypothetical protein